MVYAHSKSNIIVELHIAPKNMYVPVREHHITHGMYVLCAILSVAAALLA